MSVAQGPLNEKQFHFSRHVLAIIMSKYYINH